MKGTINRWGFCIRAGLRYVKNKNWLKLLEKITPRNIVNYGNYGGGI